MGNINEAFQLARDLITRDSSSSAAQFLLGKIHSTRNELPQAIDCFGRAHQLAPNEFDYVLEFAISLYNGNRKDEAAEAFRAAQSLQPNNQTVKNYLSLLERTANIGRRPASGPGSYGAPPPPGGTPYGQPAPYRPPSGPGAYGAPPPPGGTPYGGPSKPVAPPPRPVTGTRPVAPPPRPAGTIPPPGGGKADAIANAFGTRQEETREDRIKRLREADTAADEGEPDFSDPAFWERYHMYSTTKETQLSAAEKSGEVHCMSHDFTNLHQEEFEKELEEKAALPLYGPATGWLLSHLAWPLGAIYLGKGSSAFNRFLLQVVLICCIAVFGWLFYKPFYTDQFAKDLHGIKDYEDCSRKTPRYLFTVAN